MTAQDRFFVRNAMIIGQYTAGERTMEQIGQSFGLTRARVAQIVARDLEADDRAACAHRNRSAASVRVMADPERRRRLKFDKFETRNAEIMALRSLGIGPREIARRLKLTPNIVAGVLHRHGLCTEEKGRGFGMDTEIKRKVADAFFGGSTLKELAVENGRSIATISAWVRSV